MKKIYITSFFALGLAFLTLSKANAETTSIINNVNSSSTGENANSSVSITNNSENSSNSTSVTTNNSHSRVEINGKVYESDGDLDVQEGGNKVQIKNGSSVSVKGTSSAIISEKPSSDSAKKEKEKMEEKKEIKEKVEKQKFDISEFVKSKLQFLRDLITFKFLFGNK